MPSSASFQPFKMERKQFILQMMRIYGKPWIMIAITGFLCFLVAGVIFDIRWLIVMFMWICIILPFSLLYLFMYHGLRAVTSINLLPHSMSPEDNFLQINIFDIHRESGKEGASTLSDKTSDICIRNPDSPEIKILRSVRVDLNNLETWYPVRNGIILLFKNSDKGFLWMPSEISPGLNVFRKYAPMHLYS